MPIVDMDCVDDFWVGNDAIFVNDFLVNNKLCVMISCASGRTGLR